MTRFFFPRTYKDSAGVHSDTGFEKPYIRLQADLINPSVLFLGLIQYQYLDQAPCLHSGEKLGSEYHRLTTPGEGGLRRRKSATASGKTKRAVNIKPLAPIN